MRFLTGLWLIGALAAHGAEPLVLLSVEEAASVQALRKGQDGVRARAERVILEAAERAMVSGPWSVTFHRPEGTPAGIHDFFSEGPYWWPDPKNPQGPYIRRDGEVNPSRFTANDEDLGRMSEAVFALGSAAYLSGDQRYSQRAARILDVWFLDRATFMNPNLEFGQAVRGRNFGRGIGIIDTRPLIWCVQGIALLERSPGWQQQRGEALRRWFRDYLRWLTSSRKGLDEKQNGNNHSTWWAAQVAAYASFTGDADLLRMLADFYRHYLLPHQFQPDGSAPREEERTKSLSYSAMNLDGFTLLLRVLERRGIDLWRYEAAGGKSLARAVSYLAPFVKDPSRWRKPQISAYKPGSNYFALLAGWGLRQREYLDLQRAIGLPDSLWGCWLELLQTAGESGAR